jgi:8-oxo-dGTP pyrophosphatase MutT (NUDIX family)
MVVNKKSAGAIIYYKDKEIKFLLLKNKLKNTYWGFPKGKIEEGESLKETAKREVKEETNLENLRFLQEFKHSLTWFFRLKEETIKKEAVYLIGKIPKEDKKKVKLNHENQDFKWLNFENAIKKMNIKNNREMLKKAYEFIKNYEKQRKLF